jgi:3-deoxy-manno-octulosonate cytidylyltransferase (CMP-KDO synthetase)
VAVVPARFASTRFPGKLLHPLHGRSVLARTVARLLRVRGLDRVIVATDDARLEEGAVRCGAEVRLPSPAHQGGTDRIGEVVRKLDPAPDFVLNLQADEPFFSPSALERLLEDLRREPGAIWTLAEPIVDPEEFLRASVVKVVCDAGGRALYFSRAPIPYAQLSAAGRGRAGEPDFARPSVVPLRHVGVYAFPRALLETFLALPASPLERRESLEQLRALEHGLPIRVRIGAWPDAGIDTPQDVERLLAKYPTPADLDRAGLDRPAGE